MFTISGAGNTAFSNGTEERRDFGSVNRIRLCHVRLSPQVDSRQGLKHLCSEQGQTLCGRQRGDPRNRGGRAGRRGADAQRVWGCSAGLGSGAAVARWPSGSEEPEAPVTRCRGGATAAAF